MSLATGFLLLGFGIAGESPGDVPTPFLASVWSTGGGDRSRILFGTQVTLATAFCCFNIDWLIGRAEALRSGHVSPSSPRWCAILPVLLWILARNVTVNSDYGGVHLANELGRDTGTCTVGFHLVSRFSHQLLAPIKVFNIFSRMCPFYRTARAPWKHKSSIPIQGLQGLKAPPLLELKSGGFQLMSKIKPNGAFKRFLTTLNVMQTLKISIFLHRVAGFKSEGIDGK